MKLKKLSALILFFFFQASLIANAQDNQSAASSSSGTSAGSKSLSRQFSELRDKSNTFQEYKVVKISNLTSFWKNVQDSVEVAQKKLNVAQAEIESQQKELQTLKQNQQKELTRIKKEVEEREKAVQKSEFAVSHISVLGMDLRKENYIMLNWSIMFALLLIVAGAVYKFRQSNKLAVEKRTDFENVTQELSGYKQRLRERETALARELQTERNKVEELTEKIDSLEKQAHSSFMVRK